MVELFVLLTFFPHSVPEALLQSAMLTLIPEVGQSQHLPKLKILDCPIFWDRDSRDSTYDVDR